MRLIFKVAVPCAPLLKPTRIRNSPLSFYFSQILSSFLLIVPAYLSHIRHWSQHNRCLLSNLTQEYPRGAFQKIYFVKKLQELVRFYQVSHRKEQLGIFAGRRIGRPHHANFLCVLRQHRQIKSIQFDCWLLILISFTKSQSLYNLKASFQVLCKVVWKMKDNARLNKRKDLARCTSLLGCRQKFVWTGISLESRPWTSKFTTGWVRHPRLHLRSRLRGFFQCRWLFLCDVDLLS